MGRLLLSWLLILLLLARCWLLLLLCRLLVLLLLCRLLLLSWLLLRLLLSWLLLVLLLVLLLRLLTRCRLLLLLLLCRLLVLLLLLALCWLLLLLAAECCTCINATAADIQLLCLCARLNRKTLELCLDALRFVVKRPHAHEHIYLLVTEQQAAVLHRCQRLASLVVDHGHAVCATRDAGPAVKVAAELCGACGAGRPDAAGGELTPELRRDQCRGRMLLEQCEVWRTGWDNYFEVPAVAAVVLYVGAGDTIPHDAGALDQDAFSASLGVDV